MRVSAVAGEMALTVARTNGTTPDVPVATGRAGRDVDVDPAEQYLRELQAELRKHVHGELASASDRPFRQANRARLAR